MAFRLDGDYLPDSPITEMLVSFDLIAIDGRSLEKDARIETTVAGFLNQTFDAFPDTILSFTCSLEGDLERHRRILFGRWFIRNGDGFIRLSYSDTRNRIYTATIFRENHPYRELIEDMHPQIYQNKY